MRKGRSLEVWGEFGVPVVALTRTPPLIAPRGFYLASGVGRLPHQPFVTVVHRLFDLLGLYAVAPRECLYLVRSCEDVPHAEAAWCGSALIF